MSEELKNAMQQVERIPRARGRKPTAIKRLEQNALDELRKKRKRLVNILHQEISELEMIEHLRMIVLILRNLSFVRPNELQLMRC